MFERGGGVGRFNFKTMNIDLAEVFHHDCKSIVDQMKEKMFIFLLRRFQISIKIVTVMFYGKFCHFLRILG